MKHRLLNVFKFTLLGLSIAVIPAISSAADTTKVTNGNALTVNYSDLDLTKSEGAKVLYRRLQTAANQVCSVRTGSRDVFNVAIAKSKCVKSAMADAIRSIHNDQLDALYYNGNNTEQKS